MPSERDEVVEGEKILLRVGILKGTGRRSEWPASRAGIGIVLFLDAGSFVAVIGRAACAHATVGWTDWWRLESGPDSEPWNGRVWHT